MEDPSLDQAEELLDFARQEHARGNYATAAAMSAQAAAVCAACGDDALTGWALRCRGTSLYGAGDYEGSAEAYGAAACAARRASDAPLQAWSLWGRADALAALGQWDLVVEACDQALTVMRNYACDDQLPRTLLLRARAEYWLEGEEQALGTLEQSREAFRHAGDIGGLVWAEDFALTVSLFLGRDEQALAIAGRNLRTSRSLPDRRLEAYLRRRLGEALLAAGRPADAFRECAAARGAFREASKAADAAVCAMWMGRARDCMGATWDAVDLHREASDALEAAGPEWAKARNEALDDLADALYRSEAYTDSSAADQRLLGPVLTAGAAADLGSADLRVLLRFVAAMVHDRRAKEAEQLLELVLATGAGGDGRSVDVDFGLAAARCWIAWHADRQGRAVDEAMSLLGHPQISTPGLAQAWVLEIAGRVTGEGQPEATGYLARALAIYTCQEEVRRTCAVAGELLERTREVQMPAQGWLSIEV